MLFSFLSYFGGDRYLGVYDYNYRWFSLVDGTMSEPLPLPEEYTGLMILSDEYCMYGDEYGYFLWNYNTGEEEPVVLFE